MDFGDLKDDEAIKKTLTNFDNGVNKIKDMLELAFESDVYDKLSTKEKVDYDLFITYSLNTLYWLLLRASGDDPNSTDIKNQLNRVKEYMVKAKEAHENSMKPRIDVDAAERFIKHGVNYKESKESSEQPPNKKLKKQ
ncbi:unnamed protein product [Brassicogethes aeneus]|uniref:Nuclear nucleic acid-binding protein C1D n=1 Tax=Brassicogethes aeneus TaxID=1431903 RepID=A0A9P0FGL8_BRAAE|nr:unnamed protein product [Brassicogethes aeneus]